MEAPHTANGHPEPTAGHRGRILLVDDEAPLQRAYRRALTSAGFDVETAGDGAEAVAKFQQGRFHAVVSDIAMPQMNGVQLLHAIREHDLDVPVVLVTGDPSVETAIQALDYGALRYLVKPVEVPVLLDVVEKAVNLQRMAVMKRQALEMLGEVDKQLGDRAGLEVKFESALDKMFMVYQPIVRWTDRTVDGYEALVRSNEPTIPHPGALFDSAERLDRLNDLSRAIRAKAPLPMLNAPERGRLFYNLHVRDLNDPELFAADAPLARMADRVVLEVTERASLNEVRDVRSIVAQLREMGFKIAVDDLGAGYAGLTSFAQLEPDVVKLDMALIRDVHLSPTKKKLVRSMTQLSADMGLEVVAEGVENANERDVLVELGCDLFQGFFFAKPAPPFADVAW
jgi:EAL domain-containing protein (putative c-di-GMP-specific phosphodiesterase class I)/CheY-like chemotaxis protein